MIPVYKPFLPKGVFKYANKAFKSTWISSKGEFIDDVQDILKEKLNVKHVLLVNNGTSATHLLAKSLKFKNPNIEKIFVPDNVYVAAWNAFLFDNNLKLKLIKTNKDTFNFDQEDLVIQSVYDSSIKACLVVHNIGNVVNVPELKKTHDDMIFVEDNCEGFLGKYDGKYSGTESLASSISFFGNKNITCGEGGAFITNDTELFEYITRVHGQGQTKERFVHDVLGYNYRITNVQAAILYGQLHHLDEIIEKKSNVFNFYRKRFINNELVRLQLEEENTEHSNWMFSLRLLNNTNYKDFEKFMLDKSIETRPFFYPAKYHQHLNNEFKYDSCLNENGQILIEEVVILPSFPELTKKELNYICSCVEEFVGN